MWIILLLGVAGVVLVNILNKKKKAYRVGGTIAVVLGCVLGLLLFFFISYSESILTIVITIALSVGILLLVYVLMVVGSNTLAAKQAKAASGKNRSVQPTTQTEGQGTVRRKKRRVSEGDWSGETLTVGQMMEEMQQEERERPEPAKEAPSFRAFLESDFDSVPAEEAYALGRQDDEDVDDAEEWTPDTDISRRLMQRQDAAREEYDSAEEFKLDHVVPGEWQDSYDEPEKVGGFAAEAIGLSQEDLFSDDTDYEEEARRIAEEEERIAAEEEARRIAEEEERLAAEEEARRIAEEEERLAAEEEARRIAEEEERLAAEQEAEQAAKQVAIEQLKDLVRTKEYAVAIKKVFEILNAYDMTPAEKQQMKVVLMTLRDKTK